MLSVIHLCLSYGKYHEPWTTRFLFPIHKGNDASNLNNYRGITIIDSLRKFIYKILDTRLCKFLDKYHIIDHSQIGFTKKKNKKKHDHLTICLF